MIKDIFKDWDKAKKLFNENRELWKNVGGIADLKSQPSPIKIKPQASPVKIKPHTSSKNKFSTFLTIFKNFFKIFLLIVRLILSPKICGIIVTFLMGTAAILLNLGFIDESIHLLISDAVLLFLMVIRYLYEGLTTKHRL